MIALFACAFDSPSVLNLQRLPQDLLPKMAMSEDHKDVKMVKELIIRLAEEQEVLWIEEIIGDFVNRGRCVTECALCVHKCTVHSVGSEACTVNKDTKHTPS